MTHVGHLRNQWFDRNELDVTRPCLVDSLDGGIFIFLIQSVGRKYNIKEIMKMKIIFLSKGLLVGRLKKRKKEKGSSDISF